MDEKLEKLKEKFCNAHISFENILGVAFLGALGSVITYFLYNQLSDETKKIVKENLMEALKRQVAKFAKEN
ncbi:MAG: hypothetical protein HYU63_08405 [Armatimonadetes bacterium]|nr:hypothetical protein [Armatimonadota bacterium]